MNSKNKRRNPEITRYTLFVFVVISLYYVVIHGHYSGWQMESYTYTFYLFDYSFGFCTRFLPGALYHLFFKEVIPSQLYVIMTVLLIGIFLSVSYCLAKVIVAQKEVENRLRVLLLLSFTLTGPSILSVFGLCLGIYDTYWVIFTLLFLLLLPRKKAKYFIPLLFVLSILIHYNALTSFIMLFSLLLLYEALEREGKEKTAYLVLMAIGLICAVALGGYFFLMEKNNLHYQDMAEFNAALEQRSHRKTGEITLHYFDLVFFGTTPRADMAQKMAQLQNTPVIAYGTASLPNSFVDALNHFFLYFRMWWFIIGNSAVSHASKAATYFLATLPLLMQFYEFWKKSFHLQTKRSQKILFLLIMLQYPFTMLVCFISTDIVRWMIHAFSVQFILYIYIAHKKGELERLKDSFLWKADVSVIIGYLACYSFVLFDPLG